jgi:hypothetical protein
MRKKILIIAFLFVFAANLLGWPMFAFAADEVSFSADTNILLGNGITLKIMDGSLCDSVVVGTSSVTLTLSTNSHVDLRSYDRYLLGNTLVTTTSCQDAPAYSKINFTGQATTISVEITPSSTCAVWGSWDVGGSGGGGGGGGGADVIVQKTTTSTGKVDVSSSNGGKTTLTTSESTSATVDFPANAITTATQANINLESKTSITNTYPVPSGKNIVGSYVYNLTATAGGVSVASFSKDVTLTFTYTDSQITGLNEDTLKVYYWNGTQWTVLTSTVDKTNNKITALTNHFTYFAIIGDPSTVPPAKMAKPSDYGLKEGDLIRAVGDIDIFIISQYGYKRLFLNPVIFNMYGHLGGWSAVKSVAPSTRDAFVTSNYYRYVDSPKVYFVEVTGGDTGIFHWVNMTAADFSAQGGKADAIFTINKSELDWYPKGADKTSL